MTRDAPRDPDRLPSMTESVTNELAALAEMIERLPAEPLPGWAIGQPLSNGGSTPRPPGSSDPREEERWSEIAGQLSGLAQRRVLVIAGQAGAAAAAFAAAGAQVVAGDRPAAVPSRGNGADQSPSGLDAGPPFDVVCCDGVLHRCTDPLGLLGQLRPLCRPGGTLLLQTLMLADPERSEYLRFIPPVGDEGAPRLLAGRLAVRWMLQSAGFDVEGELAAREQTLGQIPLVCACLVARAPA
jgi:SAM-dependent methyltransferase